MGLPRDDGILGERRTADSGRTGLHTSRYGHGATRGTGLVTAQQQGTTMSRDVTALSPPGRAELTQVRDRPEGVLFAEFRRGD